MLHALYTRSSAATHLSVTVRLILSIQHRHKIGIFNQEVHVCELAPWSLNQHHWCQLTDRDLMRSSITLLVILVNLDRGCHLSDKPACRSVTGAESSQVQGGVSWCRWKYHTTKAIMHNKKKKNQTTMNILEFIKQDDKFPLATFSSFIRYSKYTTSDTLTVANYSSSSGPGAAINSLLSTLTWQPNSALTRTAGDGPGTHWELQLCLSWWGKPCCL